MCFDTNSIWIHAWLLQILQNYPQSSSQFIDRADKISTEHVINFLSNCISKGTIDMKFLLDGSNNPSIPHIQRTQTTCW